MGEAADPFEERVFRALIGRSAPTPFTWREAHAFDLYMRGQVSMCHAVRFLVPYAGREPIIERFPTDPDWRAPDWRP